MEVSIPIMESGTHVRAREEKMMICINKCEDIAFDDANSKMHDDKLMICANNCEDSAFHMEVSPPKGNDGEVSNSGCECVVGLKGNNGKALDLGRDCVLCLKGNDAGVSNSGCDCVVGLKGNNGKALDSGRDCVLCLKGNDAGVLNSGFDGVVGLKGNDGVVSSLDDDGVVGSKGNNEEVLDSGCDGVASFKGNDGVVSNLGCLKGNDGVVSSLGHDGVVGSKGNHEKVWDSGCDGVVGFKGNDGVVLNLGHDGVVGLKGNDGVVSNYSHDGVVGLKGLNDVDVEVDIVHNGDVDEERVAEMDPQDVTESSSSFGCTDDSGDGSAELSSDSEVESHFRDDNTSFLTSKGFSDLVRTRKKKLTAHWRKFIQPLMWRCKWVELQLRELHSQTCKYDKELSECEKRKRSQLTKCAIEELGLKSTPLNGQYRSVNLMKRKKRRRVEETVDLASYTSCHNLFSYYASRRSITGSLYMDDDPRNTDVGSTEKSPFANNELGINAEWASFEFKDCDAFESILRKIEDAQLHVRQLRVRMDKVVRENAGKFASSSTAAPGDEYAKNTVPNCVPPCVNPGKIPPRSILTPSQPMPEKKVMMPESVVHGSGGAVPPSNGVTSTEPAQSEGKLEKMELQSQTLSQPLQEQLHKSEEVSGQPTPSFQLVTDVPDPNGKRAVNGEQASKPRMGSKVISTRSKRKRGRRKAESGRWSKKSCG